MDKKEAQILLDSARQESVATPIIEYDGPTHDDLLDIMDKCKADIEQMGALTFEQVNRPTR